jgi:hypothetical protein
MFGRRLEGGCPSQQLHPLTGKAAILAADDWESRHLGGGRKK